MPKTNSWNDKTLNKLKERGVQQKIMEGGDSPHELKERMP